MKSAQGDWMSPIGPAPDRAAKAPRRCDIASITGGDNTYGAVTAPLYHRTLHIDTAVASVRGSYVDPAAAAAVSALHDSLGWGQSLTWISPHGHRFRAAKASVDHPYRLMLRGEDGVTVHTIPVYGSAACAAGTPGLLVTFHARHCREMGLRGYQERAAGVAASLGFMPSEIYPSRLDVCADFLVPIEELVAGRLAGRALRGGAQPNRYEDVGLLTGIDNLPRGEKTAVFSIYDARARAIARGGLRPWEDAGVPWDTPVTRVEGRFYADRLRQLGITGFPQLTAGSVRDVWEWFTGRYLRVALPNGRQTTPAWEMVQAAAWPDDRTIHFN